MTFGEFSIFSEVSENEFVIKSQPTLSRAIIWSMLSDMANGARYDVSECHITLH